MNELVKVLNKEVELKLIEIGFKKQSQGIHIYSIDKENFGWIGMNKSTKYKEISLFPIVGIGSKPVQDFFYKITGEKPKKTLISITGMPLTEISEHRYKPDWISKLEDVANEIMKMTSFLISDGIPFIKKNANLDNIIDLMVNKNFGFTHQNVYYTPICYHLAGQDELAIEALNKEFLSIQHENYAAANDFRDFYTNFLKYLEDGSFPPITQD